MPKTLHSRFPIELWTFGKQKYWEMVDVSHDVVWKRTQKVTCSVILSKIVRNNCVVNLRRTMNSLLENSGKKEAGIIIIGDEILKGHTKDLNASFLLSRLWTNGVAVKKVSFVPDDINFISEEVVQFSSKYSFVIVCGGIGPTHDDVTFEAVSKAFDKPLAVNEELRDKIQQLKSSKNLGPALLKMATLPETTRLITGVDPITNTLVKYPLMNIQNVYIFPGVPEFMQKSFTVNEHLFRAQNKFLLIKIYISANEDMIASYIESVDQKYDQVAIGSYPVFNDVYKVKLTLESECEKTLECAFNDLIKILPNEVIVSVKKCLPNSRHDHHEIFYTEENQKSKRGSPLLHLNSLSLVDLEYYLSAENTSPLSSALKSAWAVFHQTMQMYETEEVCIGFNGGKDCTAILHLYVAYMKKHLPNNTKKIVGLYFKNSNPFDEAQDFISNCETNYNLQMIIIPAGIKEGLEKLNETHPNIKAVIMGTRRHDPYSSTLRSFVATDPSWPKYMRVFPILDWSYSEVWEFLRTFELPYCQLYDEGYTSLGDSTNTHKNPSLLLPDGCYSPAYCLYNGKQERDGREKTEK